MSEEVMAQSGKAKKTAEERAAEREAKEARIAERAPIVLKATNTIAEALGQLTEKERARVFAAMRELFQIYVSPSSY